MTQLHSVTPPLWADQTQGETPRRYPVLSGHRDVDVAIVGAGITGLTAALHLKAAGLRVAVVEARRVGSGTTGTSTGNLYAPVWPRLAAIEDKHGEKMLRAVAQGRSAAIDCIQQAISTYQIRCDFKRVPFYLFSAPDDEANDEVRAETKACARAGLNPFDVPPPGFPFPATALCGVPHQAQFDPLQYVRGLAAALEGPECLIFEDSQVTATEDGEPCTVSTAAGTITARHVIKATHTPQGRYAVHAAMIPKREYAMVARVARPLPDGIYWNANNSWHYSIRPFSNEENHYVMLLGKSHKPGEQKERHVDVMQRFIRSYFDTEHIDYLWAAQNYQPADLLPYIGTSMLEKHTWFATGFAADGLVWGTLAARAISDAILGVHNDYMDLFDPQRFTPLASAKNLAKESIAVSGYMLKDHLFYGQEKALAQVGAGEGKTLKVDGEKVAAYRDEHGRLSIVSAVCPHMGCIVHWNGLEKSWDCPCHGSRFAVDGTLLEGPSQSNLATPLNKDGPDTRSR